MEQPVAPAPSRLEPSWSSYTWPPPAVTVARPSFWTAYGRHLLLFALTAASVFWTGWVPNSSVAEGAQLVVAALGIMVSHEMGHYVACRYYGLDATLPFFLPAPILNPLVGTFGAVIRIRSPFTHRRALFDVGIAGPIAGFVVCLPVLVLGTLEAKIIAIDPSSHGLSLGEPLLFRFVVSLFRDVPEGQTLLIGPLGTAAWFGLFLTGLNLIPIGQLDGGHVTYALFRERAELLARVAWWLCVGLIFFVGPSWVLWAVLVRLLGIRHPQTLNDDAPIGRGRIAVGVLGLAIFVLCFLPNPFVQSWSQFLEAAGEGIGWLRQYFGI